MRNFLKNPKIKSQEEVLNDSLKISLEEPSKGFLEKSQENFPEGSQQECEKKSLVKLLGTIEHR